MSKDGAPKNNTAPDGLSESDKLIAMVYGSAEIEAFNNAYNRFIEHTRGLAITKHLKPQLLDFYRSFCQLAELIAGEYEAPYLPDYTREEAAQLFERAREKVLSDLLENYRK